jgi:hypothetical protein
MTPAEEEQADAAIAQADSEHPPTPGSLHALRAELAAARAQIAAMQAVVELAKEVVAVDYGDTFGWPPKWIPMQRLTKALAALSSAEDAQTKQTTWKER